MDYQWIILYLLINGIVFLIYGLDKWKASHHRWRIPEHTLMLAAVFGVFGAYGGMHFFTIRHTSRSFILVCRRFLFLK